MSNVYRVRTQISGIGGGPYLSTQFFELLGASSQAGAQEAADKVAAMWSALNTVIATAAVATIEGAVDELAETDGELQASYGVSTTITQPSDASEPMPYANQGLIQLLTGVIRNGHRVIGRVFVPGPTEVSNNFGTPGPVYQSALVTAGDALFTPELNSTICVWHRPVFDSLGNLTRAGEAIACSGNTAGSYFALLRSRRD